MHSASNDMHTKCPQFRMPCALFVSASIRNGCSVVILVQNALSRVVWPHAAVEGGGGGLRHSLRLKCVCICTLREGFMFSSDLTVLHEHHQMNMRKGFVHHRCG